MKKELIIFLAGFVLVVVIFNYFNFKSQGVKLINADEFETLMNEKGIFVVQAHTLYEKEIEGTDLIVEDWENMQNSIEKIPSDKNTKILVYCRSGRMSAISSQQLADMGYKNVYDLKGGMNSWEESGRKLAQAK